MDLRELKPPSGGRKLIDSMISKVEQAQEISLGIAEALEEGNEPKLEALLGINEKFNQAAGGIAQGYGLKVCGAAG